MVQALHPPGKPGRPSSAGERALTHARVGRDTRVVKLRVLFRALPLAGGFLTLWPSTASQPTTAISNYGSGQVANRHFIVGLGQADGAFKIFSLATTNLVIDVSGFFAP